MRALLDTHIALWAVTQSPRLPSKAEAAILAAQEVFVSVASLWEIAIKHALEAFTDAVCLILDARPGHVLQLETLPPIHHDPFDRLLVAQAMAEPLIPITRDAVVGRCSSAVVMQV